jgi:drug/metabolite transporter (DMT)-like permease
MCEKHFDILHEPGVLSHAMALMTHDTRTTRTQSGLIFALISAVTFGTSGALAKGLLSAGWTPAGAVTARVWIAALVLAVPTAIALRGQWSVLRRNAVTLLAYGVVPVAGTQLAYFSAVEHMEVGLALLVEDTAPVAVLAWLWVRHGERPNARTVLGACVAGIGLLLVLDVVGGSRVSAVGVMWALAAMVGAACYFVMSARETPDLPPMVLAGGGLLVGATALTLAGLAGLLDVRFATAPATYAGLTVDWWAPALALGVVSAAIAYVTGIAATRRLGSRLASFVALFEVVTALLVAWVLLDELPTRWQLVGGMFILTGVILVKLAEQLPGHVAEQPTVEPV